MTGEPSSNQNVPRDVAVDDTFRGHGLSLGSFRRWSSGLPVKAVGRAARKDALRIVRSQVVRVLLPGVANDPTIPSVRGQAASFAETADALRVLGCEDVLGLPLLSSTSGR
jgi:hypothetical protein